MTATYSPAAPIWCAGCGHFAVQALLQSAISELAIPRHEVIVLAGIGCSGTIQNNLGTYGYHALHGRVLPTATGVHLANPDLTVIATGGDGDGYAIGMGHLVHALRRNPSFMYLVMNNGVYGLTKGQDSPTAQPPAGPIAFDAVGLGLSIPATTFLARGFVRWTDQLRRLVVSGLQHARAGHGLAFLEVLSPCIAYNDAYPQWEASLHDVDADPEHDPTNRASAFAAVSQLGAVGRQAVGLVYRDESTPRAAMARPAFAEIDPGANAREYAKILHSYGV